MKNLQKWTMALVVGVMVLATAPVLAAADPASGSFTYGVVDINQILQSTDAAKGIFTEIEGKRKEYQGEIAKEEEQLRSTEQSIIKQKDSLSKDEFSKKRKEFDERVMSAQKMVQGHKNTLDQAFSESMVKLRREAAKIVAEIAKEKGYSAVFTQDALILAAHDMDITKEVIDRMNKNVKKIQVDWTPKSKT